MARTKVEADQRTRPPLQRMLHIHAALDAEKYPTATTLGQELEVSSRSIHRDIDFMRDRLQLPIAYDSNRFGFYYTEKVRAFPSFQISEGELFALLVAEKALQQYRGTTFEKPLLSAFRKMTSNLPDVISFNLGEWNNSISFRTSAEPIINLETFDTLSRATANRDQLKLTYRKPGKQTGEIRLVDPYHLANVNGEWFLFAHCHLRNDIRTFVPARILKIEKTGKRFAAKKFSIERELRNSFGIHSGQGEHKVILRFNELVSDYIREKKWHPSQKLRELPNGRLELQLTLSSLVEVQRWVLAWGGNAQVVQPPELAESVRIAANSLLAFHPGK